MCHMPNPRHMLHPEHSSPSLTRECSICSKTSTEIVPDTDPNSDGYYIEYCKPCFNSHIQEIQMTMEYGSAYPHMVDGLIIPATRPETLPDPWGSQ